MTAAARTSRPLLARICALPNLEQAWQRVRSKGARGGADGESVADFAASLDRQLERLRDELLSERYVPEAALRIEVPKASKPGERRGLSLPSVRDKVAQEAVRRVIDPILDRAFLDCSYGYRPGRGPQRAVKRVAHHLESGKCDYVALADIDDFFDSVDHGRLLGVVRGQIHDEAVLRLIEIWLRMGTVDGHGRWRDVYGGVQQGSLLAPLLANAFLSPFDQSMTSRGYSIVRYADDFVFCCRGRTQAEAVLAAARSFLEERLGLHLNHLEQPVRPVAEGFPFLGIWFEGGRRTIAAAKLDAAGATLRKIVGSSGNGRSALHALGEKAAGWRRYYGAVVSPDGLGPLDELHRSALAQLLERERNAGRVTTRTEARELLRNVELVTPCSSEERAAAIEALAGVGRAPSPATPTAAPAGHARPSASGRGRDQRAGPARPAKPATVVRRAKRGKLRRLVSTQELVVDRPGSFVGTSRGRIVVRRDRRTTCEVPLNGLRTITLTGPGITLSTDAIRACGERRIPILLVTGDGRIEATAGPSRSADARTALAQVRALAAGRPAIGLAARFVTGKVATQAATLQYLAKNRRRADAALHGSIADTIERMRVIAREALREEKLDDVERARGRLFSIEGRAASLYWAGIAKILSGRVEFAGRVRRGATDLVNSMLNYGYAVLQARVALAIVRAGLEPQISFLHAAQPGVPTLSFDLMEEFRAPIVDRTVIGILMRRRAASVDENGRLADQARRVLLGDLLARLAGLVRWRGRECTLCDVLDQQARALAEHLAGEAPYRAYSFKW